MVATDAYRRWHSGMSGFYAEGMGGGTEMFHVKLLFDRRYQGELSENTGQRNAPPAKPGFYGSH